MQKATPLLGRLETGGVQMSKFYCLIALALGACAQNQISDADACISYGAVPGTQQYFQCRMAKDQQRQAIIGSLLVDGISRPQPHPYVLPMPH